MSAAIEPEIVSFAPSFLAPINSELTTKQNLFVHYYLEERNGVKAAKLAGYSGDVNSLNQIARGNLQNPTIRQSLEDHWKARIAPKEAILSELSDIAMSPWKDHVEVKYGPNNEILAAQVKLSDKIKAAELIGKHHKLWDSNSLPTSQTLNIHVENLTVVLQSVLNEITSTDTES